MATSARQRRSLRYIRLAAFLASQPPAIDRLELTIPDVEEVVGQALPPNARFPSWWRNDPRRMHSRAWLSAGWEVAGIAGAPATILFVRQPPAR